MGLIGFGYFHERHWESQWEEAGSPTSLCAIGLRTDRNGPIIELESPTVQIVNTRGISQKLREAQQQISDHRTHLKENWKDLQLAGLPGTQQQARSWIIIGRRKKHAQQDRKRVIDIRNDNIEVASYDRLHEKLKSMVEFRVQSRVADKKFIASLNKPAPKSTRV